MKLLHNVTDVICLCPIQFENGIRTNVTLAVAFTVMPIHQSIPESVCLQLETIGDSDLFIYIAKGHGRQH